MNTFENDTDIFALTIDYSTYKGDPANLLQKIADVINSFKKTDEVLAKTFYNSISASYELINIEHGSIKLTIKQILENIPNEALAELDIKKLIGSFLVRGKHKIIKLINDNEKLDDIEKLDTLREDLLIDAKSNDVLPFKDYREIENTELIEAIIDINTKINSLPKNTNIYYINSNNTQKISKDFSISNELLQMISENSFRVYENTMTIKVKQPDYLSKNAMWTFKIEDRKTIEAKFDDLEWLNNFQKRKFDVRPEDSLSVLMKITTDFDNKEKITRVKYNIMKVYKILPFAPLEQATFIK